MRSKNLKKKYVPKKKRPFREVLLLWLAQKTRETKESLITLVVFLITGSLCAILFFMLLEFLNFNIVSWFQELPYISPIASSIVAQIKAGTILGTTYLFSFSSLFFIPTPLEVLAYSLLKKQTIHFLPMALAILAGLMIGQHLNYWGGRLFANLLKGFIKKKTKRSIAKKLRSYGFFAVFIMNLLIFPYPLANAVFGVVKYPYHKWLPATLLAFTIKIMCILFIIQAT